MSDFSHRLASQGLSLQAWLPVASLNGLPDVLPGAHSLWLLGSPGGGLWRSFQRHLALHNPGWSARSDPFDDFVAELLAGERAAWEAAWGETYTLTPSEMTHPVDFVGLATAAGWGMPGPLGMAIHPRYGPWFGLRAAVLTRHRPAAFAAALAHSLCDTCAAPCLAACPANAVTREGWQFDACVPHRLTGHGCQTTCHARLACPVGDEHRYPDEALAFFMGHSLQLLHKHHVTTDQK